MKNLPRIIWTVIALLVVGYFVCDHLYEKKYDSYYEQVMAERIPAAAADGTLKLRVNIRANQTEYHHLGENIKKAYTCNGQTIKDGDIIPYTKTLSFKATITENDSTDDVGTATVQLSLPPFYNEKSVELRVDERGGRRYPNAYAIWKITFEVEPVIENLKIGYFAVVFS